MEWVDIKDSYFEMADGCYFIDLANLIVNPLNKEFPNYKLNPLATYITKFLIQQVRVEMVGALLRDRYPEMDVKTVVPNLVNQLLGHGLIKPMELPKEVSLSEEPKVGPISKTTLTVCVLPLSARPR